MITFEDVKNNETIKTYIRQADKALISLGYTEHSFAHVTKTAHTAAYILRKLEYDQHEIELVSIAGYLHDIGNLVNRVDHSQSGAILAFRILDNLNMDPSDIAQIVSAIGNHDEGTGIAVDHLSAALILADKSDVRRSRVRNREISSFDIHDRVNYSVVKSQLFIDDDNTIIELALEIDTEIGSVMDYFEIFLGRMVLCKKAANKLGLRFTLEINGQRLI